MKDKIQMWIAWKMPRWLEELVDTAREALDFAWDELTDTEGERTVPIPHWCGFTQNPESGYCSTHEGIGMLQKLRYFLSRFEESHRRLRRPGG